MSLFGTRPSPLNRRESLAKVFQLAQAFLGCLDEAERTSWEDWLDAVMVCQGLTPDGPPPEEATHRCNFCGSYFCVAPVGPAALGVDPEDPNRSCEECGRGILRPFATPAEAKALMFQRRCSACGAFGHKRPTCPVAKPDVPEEPK